MATLAVLLASAWVVDAGDPVAAAPAGFRLPFVGDATWSNGSAAHGSLKREVDYIPAGGPNAWNRDVIASETGRVIYRGYQTNTSGRLCPYAGATYLAWGNLVILKHDATGHTSYYAHLESFADGVTLGATIEKGRPIGRMGNTGCSSQAHLHFEVRDSSGNWVVITDLPGMSSNGTATGPPTTVCRGPGLTGPPDGANLSSTSITFSWNAPADCGYSGYQFRIRRDTNFDDPAGNHLVDTGWPGTSISCPRAECSIPPGNEGRDLYWGVRTANPLSPNWSWRRFRISSDGTNDPGRPQQGDCNPGSTEVCIFADTGYRGAWVKRGIGEYASPGNLERVGNDNAESVRVGSEAMVQLFADEPYGGRRSEIRSDDPDLSDNEVGANTVSSFKVLRKPAEPGDPFDPNPSGSIDFCDGPDFNPPCERRTVGKWDLGSVGQSVESIRFNGGYVDRAHVVIFERPGQSGNLAHLDASTRNLFDSFDNNVRSVDIYIKQPPDTARPRVQWLAPADGVTIRDRVVELRATAADSGGSGLDRIQFSAKWGGTWNVLHIEDVSGDAASASYAFDLCEWGVPDGDIELGLETWDGAGNNFLWSEHGGINPHITKDRTCDPPPAPAGVTATGLGPTEVSIDWTGSPSADGYRVLRADRSQVASVGADVDRYVARGLAPATQYSFYVCASNSAGETCSSLVTASTLAGRPDAPEDITGTALDQSSIQLTWADVANETGYRIKCWNGSAFETCQDGLAPDTVSYVVSGLNGGKIYYYEVCAYNDQAETCGAWIEVITPQPEVTEPPTEPPTAPPIRRPAAPVGVRGSVIGPTEVRVEWTDASDDETRFELRRSDAASESRVVAAVAADATSAVDPDAVPGTDYFYAVCATNAAGTTCSDITLVSVPQVEQPPVRTQPPVTTAPPVRTEPPVRTAPPADDAGPSQPRTPAPLRAPTGASASGLSPADIRVEWLDVVGEDGYRIKRWDSSTAEWVTIMTVGANAASHVDTGLRADTEYAYLVCAFAGTDEACPSEWTSARTFPAVVFPEPSFCDPGPDEVCIFADRDYTGAWVVRSIGEYASPGNLGEVGNDDAESVIVGADVVVQLFADEAYGPPMTELAADTPDLFFTDVGADSVSSFKVLPRPFDGVGPATPIAPSATAIGDEVLVEWIDAADDENGYWVRRDDGTPDWPIVAIADADATSATDVSPTFAEAQLYSVCAYNDAGESCTEPIIVYSDLVEVEAPEKVDARGIAPRRVRVRWTPSPGAVGHRVERLVDGDWRDIAFMGGEDRRYVDGDLDSDTTYTYRVCAVNSTTEACSDAIEGTTRRFRKPSRPAGVSATAGGTNSILIEWSPSERAEAYLVQRRTGRRWRTITRQGPDVVSWLHSSLRPGATYSYRVCATNTGDTVCSRRVTETTAESPGVEEPPTSTTSTTNLVVPAADSAPVAGPSVRIGDIVRVKATGVWCIGGTVPTGECGGPGGIRAANPGESDERLASAQFGTLIGRVGQGQWFVIGADRTFTVGSDARLWLSMNDRECCFGDNSGSIAATVSVTR